MEMIKVNVENVNGVLVTTSNRVAQELGVNHYDLLERRIYREIHENGKFRSRRKP